MYKTYEIMIQVSTLKSEGLSNTAIANRLGIHRQTVAKYLKLCEQARESGSHIDELLPKEKRRKRLIDPYLDHINARLEAYPALTAKRLFKEIQQQGYTGSMRTVRRYVSPLRPHPAARVYKPYETPMGEQAQVDWGEETWVVDGQKRKIYVFAFILSHSRMRYVEYVTTLDSIVFLNCLQRAFEYIGGVPKTVLFDNAKTVVSSREGGTIRFQSDLLQYAATVRFQPKACWVNDPESKGKVESTIGYVHEDFYYGSSFESFEELNRRAFEWAEDVNRQVHSTTQRVPVEVWEAEKRRLTPLPKNRPSLFRVKGVKVDKTCLFQFDCNKYSVPWRYARQKIRLEVFEHEFRAMSGGEEIGRWERTHEKNKRFLVEEHYAGRYKGNRQSVLEAQFQGLCDEADEYLRGLASTRGNCLKEQMEQIVELAEDFSAEEIGRAMLRAIRHKNYGYGPLKKILIRFRQSPDSLPAARAPVSVENDSLPHVRIDTRDLSYYSQHVEGGEEKWIVSSPV